MVFHRSVNHRSSTTLIRWQYFNVKTDTITNSRRFLIIKRCQCILLLPLEAWFYCIELLLHGNEFGRAVQATQEYMKYPLNGLRYQKTMAMTADDLSDLRRHKYTRKWICISTSRFHYFLLLYPLLKIYFFVRHFSFH